MSRAGPTAKRVKNDAYMTPPDVAKKCVLATVDTVGDYGGCVIEPSVGGGSFLAAAKELIPRALRFAVDIDPDAPGLKPKDQHNLVGDWLEVRGAPFHGAVIIGNPPYSEAELHLRHAFTMQPLYVGALLRLGFLATESRREFWKEHPCDRVHVLINRPSFTGNGKTDGADYAWFEWYFGPSIEDEVPATKLFWI
jgi:hypothetical protein